MKCDYRLHQSQPGQADAVLLETLLEITRGVPSGGTIRAAFYYLRNMRLCQALVDARRRGVRVCVLISGRSHVRHANREVVSRLRREGFGSDLRIRHRGPLGRARMHLKLFLASRVGERENVILTGTYNPSGNDDPDEKVLRIIGDQDRGYNYLLELSGAPELYAHLAAHYDALHARSVGWRWIEPTREYRFGDISVRALPTRSNPLLVHLRERLASGAGGNLRIAASHVSHRSTVALLGRLQSAGHHVEVIGHDSERRFPAKIEASLRRSGVAVRRYVHPERYPMHCKFILSEYPDAHEGLRRDLFLGSMNLNFRSYYFNDDLFLRFSDPALYGEFADLWERISRAIESQCAETTHTANPTPSSAARAPRRGCP